MREMDLTVNPHDDMVPLDLSALDFDMNGGAEERLVRRVMTMRRAVYPVNRDVLLGVWALRRYSALVVAAALMLWFVRERELVSPQTVAQAIGVPPEFMSATRILPVNHEPDREP